VLQGVGEVCFPIENARLEPSLGGGVYSCSPLFGEDSQFDFRWVESTNENWVVITGNSG